MLTSKSAISIQSLNLVLVIFIHYYLDFTVTLTDSCLFVLLQQRYATATLGIAGFDARVGRYF